MKPPPKPTKLGRILERLASSDANRRATPSPRTVNREFTQKVVMRRPKESSRATPIESVDQSRHLPPQLRPTREEEGDTFVHLQAQPPHAPTATDRKVDTPTQVPVSRMKPQAFGGDEMGKVGITPIEKSGMAKLARQPSGPTRHLVDAITHYVDDRVAKHFADLIRQGVL